MRLSIIIPVYNTKRYLRAAIDSAMRAGSRVQGPWELLLVDNNSTDGSLEILQQYQREHPQSVQLLRAKRQGAPAARNVALARARGEWVQFLDADDYLYDDKIAEQLQLVDEETDWVIGAFRNLWVDGSSSDDYPLPDPWQGLVYNHFVGNTNANLYRRTALNRIGGWNEDTPLCDDPNLHFRLLKAGAPYLIDPIVRSVYRHHDGSERVTNSPSAAQGQQTVEMIREVIVFLKHYRPAYFSEHLSHFRGALLRQLRILATNDLVAAEAGYRNYLGDYRGERLQLVPRYTRLYPMLGFRRLEALRLWLATVLPEGLKHRLKS